ncbi:hypothetical protein GOP47_0012040 [Adiantum capillus-veneris]|uniref:Late embryogenesis abundant protein LEA-2 subgroup domain-containing protein n=1 Tax=Adiantum capillus-veneris TaxID=13818 RepID=A0A9D4UUB5_ADICA|nr:hypothetical protein GOP47_0012040 [Adiantum capillus-veneris]
MGHQCHYHRRKQRQKAACAICLFVTILLIILLLILYFAVFKPKDPSVRVPLMQMAFYQAQGLPPSVTTISFGLNLQVTIYNPNRGTFYMEGTSTASLYYGNAQLGLTILPNNTHIPSQSSLIYGVSLPMQRPILVNLTGLYSASNTIVPLPTSSIITVFGHVTTAGSFTRHSSVASVCNITIGLASSTGSILSYSCKKSYSIED